MKKTIDAFLLFNELDMLEFHLHSMNESVDYFVIGESSETFAGNHKELLFDLNRGRYAQFAEKIIHVPIENSPTSSTAWDREEFQRDALLRGILTIPNLKDSDIILVSDVDEIVDENLLKTIGPIQTDTVYALEQDIYYYNLNSRFREKQCFTRLCNVGLAKQFGFQHIRFRMRAQILRPGGWHFSYFGSPASIATKIQNFSHQDLNQPHIVDENRIQHVINNGTDLFGRNQKKPEKYQIDHIPIDANDYLPRHHHMLLNCETWQLSKPTP